MDIPVAVIPGPFVVLQGMAGDGISNSIDSMPVVQYHDEESPDSAGRGGFSPPPSSGRRSSRRRSSRQHHDMECDHSEDDNDLDDFQHVPQQQQQQQHVKVASASNSSDSIVIVNGGADDIAGGGGDSEDNLGASRQHAQPSSLASPPRARRRRDGRTEGEWSSGRSSGSRETDEATISSWRLECREREIVQLAEVAQQWQGRRNVPVRGESDAWWQRDGRAAVFASPSIHPSKDFDDEDVVEDVLVLGTLPPGSVVRGCEMVPALPSFRSVGGTGVQRGDGNGDRRGGTDYHDTPSECIFLRIESPISGFVLYRRSMYVHLAPGRPESYCNPSTWIWRVTCPDGSFVRSGLELNSSHLTTVPYGVLVKVTRKTVNAMGLSRLRLCRPRTDPSTVAGGLVQGNEVVGCDATTIPQSNLNPTNRRNSSGGGRGEGGGDSSPPLLEGWISEALNPLSGQRGPIAQPLPFPLPALYRVTLADGAVIRSDIELSSSEVRVAPFGSVIRVVGRAFSEHPMDQCIERLRLAGGGGWVSVRLNRPPPLDVLIVELIGIDEEFDPEDPGSYHLRMQREHEEMMFRAGRSLDHGHSRGRGSRGGDTMESSAALADGGGSSFPSQSPGVVNSRPRRRSGHDSRKDDSKVGKSGLGGRKKHFGKGQGSEEKCLICLTEERTATIVHGETGHIACCLTCARILKARGDKCPVCRLPIDLVIQQFWA